MARIDLWPSCTMRFRSRDAFSLPAGSVYLYGESGEKRSHLPAEWVASQACTFVRIEEQGFEDVAFSVGGTTYMLRSSEEMARFSDTVIATSKMIHVDITGLSHHVWAPVFSRLVDQMVVHGTDLDLRTVYVEPVHYTKSRVPRPGDIFALSDRLHGLRPLPGLARLRREGAERAMIVALLGFEGWRFDAILAKLEPDAGTVVPVVGVPGFRSEYPFYALEGNIIPLERDDNWMNREFVTANDPFEVFGLLDSIQRDRAGTLIRIAMVGTKPHALGAVLYHTLRPAYSELIYDNPVRSAGRTDADRTILQYDVSQFIRIITAA